jgi:hypothetical protein
MAEKQVCETNAKAEPRSGSRDGDGLMVWGMNLPSGFGQFWPEGQFEGKAANSDGWWERMIAHYLAQSHEEQQRLFDNGGELDASGYASYVSGKFIHEQGAKESPDRPPFTPIEPHEAPLSFVTEKTYRTLGSLIALNFGLLAVDEALKSIIERLEPGVHGFYPIHLIMPKGAVFPNRYYALVIGQWFDSFSPDESSPDSWEKNGEFRIFYSKTKKGISGLALSKTVFGNANLWRERRCGVWLTCFSDELRAEIERAGLDLPKLQKMKEV